MVNILGEDLPVVEENISLLEIAKLHLYGKKDPAPKRKMGHITIMTDKIEKEIERTNLLWGKK